MHKLSIGPNGVVSAQDVPSRAAGAQRLPRQSPATTSAPQDAGPSGIVVDIEPSGIVVGATGMDAIVQNIRIIVTTLAYSCPLDRAFASTGSFIDAPAPHEVARKVAELTEVIEAKEARVRVTGITYAPRPADTMEGRVYPTIHFALREGVTL